MLPVANNGLNNPEKHELPLLNDFNLLCFLLLDDHILNIGSLLDDSLPHRRLDLLIEFLFKANHGLPNIPIQLFILFV